MSIEKFYRNHWVLSSVVTGVVVSLIAAAALGVLLAIGPLL